MPDSSSEILKLPDWLRVKTGKAQKCAETRATLQGTRLHTVCENAKCPNIGECYSQHTATFLILGNTCTRACRFCAVNHGSPLSPDPTEPARLAVAVRELNLNFAVVTSVTRDDLPDGGAGHFAATVEEIRKVCAVETEILTPDFQGSEAALETVLGSQPAVFNHNVETIERLSPVIRPQASYERSLGVIRNTQRLAPHIPRKSGFMVGLGETDDEVRDLISEIADCGCQILTIGQYLRPSRHNWPVQRYVPPERFEEYAAWAHSSGIAIALAGPFVRSSYRAAEVVAELKSQTV
jgi:lipoic acid synthetase